MAWTSRKMKALSRHGKQIQQEQQEDQPQGVPGKRCGAL